MKFEISQVIKICRGNFEVIATKFSQKFKWNILRFWKTIRYLESYVLYWLWLFVGQQIVSNWPSHTWMPVRQLRWLLIASKKAGRSDRDLSCKSSNQARSQGGSQGSQDPSCTVIQSGFIYIFILTQIAPTALLFHSRIQMILIWCRASSFTMGVPYRPNVIQYHWYWIKISRHRPCPLRVVTFLHYQIRSWRQIVLKCQKFSGASPQKSLVIFFHCQIRC